VAADPERHARNRSGFLLLEVDGERHLHVENGVPCVLLWTHDYSRGCPSLERVCPLQAQVSRLACLAQQVLDGRPPRAQGAADARALSVVRHRSRDDGPLIAAVLFLNFCLGYRMSADRKRHPFSHGAEHPIDLVDRRGPGTLEATVEGGELPCHAHIAYAMARMQC
jgi:hypothetical protein